MGKLKTQSIRLRMGFIALGGALLILSLAFGMITKSIEDKRYLDINILRTNISNNINELAALQAQNRGLGVTVLSGNKNLIPRFEDNAKSAIPYFNKIEGGLLQYKAIVGLNDELDTIILKWREQHDVVLQAKAGLINSTITIDNWFNIMSDIIASEFIIRDLIFKPINNEESVFYDNAILRPSLSLMSEYAGKQRALMSQAITKNQPIAKDTQADLLHIDQEIDKIILQIELLKHSPSISSAFLEAVKSYEDIFIKKFGALKGEVYSISDASHKIIEAQEHSITHFVSNRANSIKDMPSDQWSKTPKDIYLIAKDENAIKIADKSINNLLQPIMAEIMSKKTGTIVRQARAVTFSSAYYSEEDPTAFLVYAKASSIPSYPLTGEEWFNQATIAINSLLDISRAAGQTVSTAQGNNQKQFFERTIIEFTIVALAIFFLIVTVLSGKEIANRLQTIGIGLHRIAGGQLSTRLELNNPQHAQEPDKLDELDQLILNINLMTKKLEVMVENIRLAEASAKDANISKSQFLSNMSHEIRTPLNAIIGFSTLIKDELFGKLGNEKYAEYIQDIEISGHHLLELINDLLDISSIEAGKLEMEPVALNMEEEIATCCNLTKVLTKSKNLTVINEDSTNPNANIFVDARRFRQIMLNILSNAIKYTANGGTITFTKDLKDDDTIKIVVRDTGVGMPPEVLKNIFKAYSRSDDDYSKKQEGTGLGLYLTQELIKAIGGEMQIDSELGVGTAVTITLPLYKETYEPLTPESLISLL